MRILKAYENISAMGQQNFGSPREKVAQERTKPVHSQVSRSGDCLHLSEQARELLANGGKSISVMPQDATYDKQGNVMRQFDNLQSDLRALTSQFIGVPGSAGVLSRLGSMQSQVTGLRAQV